MVPTPSSKTSVVSGASSEGWSFLSSHQLEARNVLSPVHAGAEGMVVTFAVLVDLCWLFMKRFRLRWLPLPWGLVAGERALGQRLYKNVL